MLGLEKLRFPFLLRFAVFVAIFVAPGNAKADQVIFINGDRISGHVICISDTEIQITTEYAGTICADFSQVLDMKTETPGKIMLKNGDLITGVIECLSPEFIVIESQDLGMLQLVRDQFHEYTAMGQAESLPPELEAGADALQAPESDLEEDKKVLAKEAVSEEKLSPDYWSGSFTVGAQLRRGNTDTADVHTEFKAMRKAPREELNLRFYSDYGETEGETDRNKAFGQAKLKILKTDRLYLFGVADMEYDEMAQLDLRAQGFDGLGYKLIARERTTLLGEAGAGLTGEFFDADGDEENLEASAILAAELTQKLFEHVVLYQGITLFPSLGDFGEYRLRSESTLTSPLGDGWAIKLSLIDDYDSDPENEDVEKNDLRFISAIEYTF
jgi:putative salt-induced outer membrane protein YdiY